MCYKIDMGPDMSVNSKTTAKIRLPEMTVNLNGKLGGVIQDLFWCLSDDDERAAILVALQNLEGKLRKINEHMRAEEATKP